MKRGSAIAVVLILVATCYGWLKSTGVVRAEWKVIKTARTAAWQRVVTLSANLALQIMEAVVASKRFEPVLDRITEAALARMDTPKHHAAVAQQVLGVTSTLLQSQLGHVPVIGRCLKISARWMQNRRIQQLGQPTQEAAHNSEGDDLDVLRQARLKQTVGRHDPSKTSNAAPEPSGAPIGQSGTQYLDEQQRHGAPQPTRGGGGGGDGSKEDPPSV